MERPAATPALPIKQRRNHSLKTRFNFDVQHEDTVVDLPASSPLFSPFIDVFTSTTDCNAVQCPLHSECGYHQGRFLSEQTPPPIPKKKLVRTLSLPAEPHCSTAQHGSSCVDNLATELKDPPKWNPEVTDKAENFDQFKFDLHNPNLPDVFGCFYPLEQMHIRIQNYYHHFMRNMVKHLKAKVLSESEESEALEHFPSAEVNQNVKTSINTMTVSPNPSTEEHIVYKSSSTEQSKGLTTLEEPELLHGCRKENHCTKLFFLERSFSFSIVRDHSWGTLEDYVKEGISWHCSQSDMYHRRVCLLMLQLVLGLQDLEKYNVKIATLHAQELLLVWLHSKNEGLCEMIKATRGNLDGPVQLKGEADKPMQTTEDINSQQKHEKKIDMLWEKWGTPQLMISHGNVQSDSYQSIQTKVGLLLKYCLQETTDTFPNTQYKAVLLQLINMLTAENCVLQTADVVGILQALLWGPKIELLKKKVDTVNLQNWLMLKRSMLVLNLAEKGLSSNQHVLNWEDYLCLHYLSCTDPQTILKTLSLFYSIQKQL